MQTWPATFNPKFQEDFTLSEYPDNPDPDHFCAEALEEFKDTMLKLFNIDRQTPNLPIKFAYKKTNNEERVYVGGGEALMALLRLNSRIRKDLDIETLLEPDGFISRWKRPKETGTETVTETGTKEFFMDLTLEYCLYTKKGWETMACVKARSQFAYECSLKPEVASWTIDEGSTKDGACDSPLDLEWFSHEAYKIVLKSTLFVWLCAVLMVLIFVAFPEWAKHSELFVIATAIAATAAVYADASAMKWCIVPWLQKTRKLDTIVGGVPFGIFRPWRLVSTVLRVVTIHANAFFMVTAVINSNAALDGWISLWRHSMIRFLPNLDGLAVLLWLLSTSQLFLPLATFVPLDFRGKNKSFLTTWKQRKQEHFLPEMYYHDFNTLWSKLHACLGFKQKKCSYRQSVAMLAIASGLCYTGSCTVSYPKKLIEEIIHFKRGYKIYTGSGFEQVTPGWEMRALKEFKKLIRAHQHRVTFIMVFKLALQMNLQISLFVVQRMQGNTYWKNHWKVHVQQTMSLDSNSSSVMDSNNVERANLAGVVSIVAMILNFGAELYDVYLIFKIYYSVRKAVKDRVWKIKDDEPYAFDHFIVNETQEIKENDIKGKELKKLYFSARRKMMYILITTLLCTWLVGYALLKAIMSFICPTSAWQLSGCIESSGRCKQYCLFPTT